MRHLLAELNILPLRGQILPHAAAKVQKVSERCKSEAGAKRVRRESLPHGNMIAISACRMAKCQRAESPTMHKL